MKKVLSVVLALVMCISVFAGCGGSKNAAKTLDMKTLLQTTAKQLVKESETIEKNLLGYNSSQTEGYCQLSVNADDVNIPVGTASINSFEASLAGAVSDKENEMKMVIDGTVNDVALSLIELVWGEDVISLASPALIDKTFTLPTKNFAEGWNKSVFGSLTQLTDVPDLSFSSLFKISEEAKKIQKEILDLTVNFLSSCEQTHEETEITLNGKNTAVTKFAMVVSADELKTYLNSMSDSILKIYENDFYKSMLSMGAEQEGMTFDEMMSEVKKQLTEELDKIEFEDVTFYIYGCNKKIVRIEYAGVIENVDILVYFQFKNPDYLLDGMELVVEAKNLETEEVVKCKVDMNGTLVQGKDVLTFNFDITAEEDETEMDFMNMDMKFDYTSNVYNINLNLDDDGETVEIKVDGNCHRGDMFELSLDNIVYSDGYSTISVNNMIKQYIGGELKINVKAAPNAAKMELTSTSSSVSAFELTETDIENMQGEVTKNLESIMKQLGISMY